MKLSASIYFQCEPSVWSTWFEVGDFKVFSPNNGSIQIICVSAGGIGTG